jgi:hypothetical protein
MLKFALKKERLNFMQGWSTMEKTMREREPDEGIDLLLQLLREEDTEDVIDQIICDLDDEEDGVL